MKELNSLTPEHDGKTGFVWTGQFLNALDAMSFEVS